MKRDTFFRNLMKSAGHKVIELDEETEYQYVGSKGAEIAFEKELNQKTDIFPIPPFDMTIGQYLVWYRKLILSNPENEGGHVSIHVHAGDVNSPHLFVTFEIMPDGFLRIYPWKTLVEEAELYDIPFSVDNLLTATITEIRHSRHGDMIHAIINQKEE